MAITQTQIELLDSNLNLITLLRAEIPLDAQGTILRYSKELSDFGTCTFRISSYDPLFPTLGDILTPHSFHIRVRKAGNIIWSGAIIENTKRTKDYIEVVAAEYIWYLNKILIQRNLDANFNTTTTNAIYRRFSSGGMDAAVTAIMNETIARFAGTNHALASMTLGTIQNPNYPPNMENAASPPLPLTGPWMFGNGTAAPMLTFDFQSIMYVLKSFGAYTFADFQITENLVFNFQSFIGQDNHYDVNFNWGDRGNAVDFNIPRLGQRQVNDLWGIAVDNSGNVLFSDQTDQPSISTNGILEQVAAYSDIKDQATLNARTAAELPLIKSPDSAAVTFTLDGEAYPLGQYDIGDIITAKVAHTGITYNEIRRIVGISVNLNSTGRELVTVQLNQPQPWQFGQS